MSDAPAIAVIGCGAIAEAFHVPSLVRDPAVQSRLVLVDPDVERAAALGRRHGISRTAADLDDVLDEVDGAVVAAPHHLHVPLTVACARAGVHVLCEKPLAGAVTEVEEILDAAREGGVTVGVNQMRRLYPASRAVKEMIDQGRIGRPVSLEYFQGEQFDWPAATGSYFGSGAGGRGVLLDIGAHVVDLACWWLGGKPELSLYRDDAMGGTEAVAELLFERDGCRGRIRLSWLSRYSNTYRVVGDEGAIEGHLYDEDEVTLVSASGRRERVRRRGGKVADAMIDGFLDAVRGRSAPPVPAEEVLPSVALIEECYDRRERFDMPWYEDQAPVEAP